MQCATVQCARYQEIKTSKTPLLQANVGVVLTLCGESSVLGGAHRERMAMGQEMEIMAEISKLEKLISDQVTQPNYSTTGTSCILPCDATIMPYEATIMPL